jgi:hypothetical protein
LEKQLAWLKTKSDRNQQLKSDSRVENDIIKRMLNRFIKILTISVVGIVFLPIISLAQTTNTSHALTNELGVNVLPTYPKPNDTVSINLTLYTDDLNSANINWYKDGKEVLSGKGETTYSFKTGPAGTENKITIDVSLLSGASFSKTLTLNPVSVDLVWEANSYVPPFYKGKALHPRQGSLKLVAIPEFIKNGKRISSANLIYQWSNGLDVYQSQSGYGKNVVTIDGSLLGKEEKIKVSVTDPITNLVAQGSINITPVDPEIIFYENDPYYGNIFDSAVTGAYSLKTDEVQILAAPFYFTKESGDALTYLWQLNGQTISNLAGSLTAVFRRPEDKTTGTSNVSLQIDNANKILQQANNNLMISFEK